jgi:hypothetical protein
MLRDVAQHISLVCDTKGTNEYKSYLDSAVVSLEANLCLNYTYRSSAIVLLELLIAFHWSLKYLLRTLQMKNYKQLQRTTTVIVITAISIHL